MAECKTILLLGDSRRMGYEPFVRKALEGRAQVYGPQENGRWAGYTLNSLRFWLNEFPTPDIVHWNCGLWDLGDDYHLGRPFSLPEEYESAVERTVVVLRKLFPGVKIIFATTMPAMHGDTAGVQAYNDIIRKIAEKEGIPVDDLFATMHAQMTTYDQGDHLHLNDEGNTIVAGQIAGVLEKYL
ncbi:MAG: SGNH/GDSL hydrolase family protein [Clostridiales bacterium]|nr:SGNH/GDSL hydrolase family protein [Clostridiales bacterium]